MSSITTREVGVCSWSLQVTSVPELRAFLDTLGIRVVQIACGDPHHAIWIEGDDLPGVAKAAGLVLSGAMLGFPGEDYTSPATIHHTGGFGNPATRPERLERLKWGLHRTTDLGLRDLMFHAGFIPPPGNPARRGMLDTLAKVGELATDAGVTVAFETGQESATILKQTLEELKCPSIRINFDPANVVLYGDTDPLGALELLAEHVRSVHVKDATPPTKPGEWGTEVPLGQGVTNTAAFVSKLASLGYTGPLCIEREVGTQSERLADIAHGIELLKSLEA